MFHQRILYPGIFEGSTDEEDETPPQRRHLRSGSLSLANKPKERRPPRRNRKPQNESLCVDQEARKTPTKLEWKQSDKFSDMALNADSKMSLAEKLHMLEDEGKKSLSLKERYGAARALPGYPMCTDRPGVSKTCLMAPGEVVRNAIDTEKLFGIPAHTLLSRAQLVKLLDLIQHHHNNDYICLVHGLPASHPDFDPYGLKVVKYHEVGNKVHYTVSRNGTLLIQNCVAEFKSMKGISSDMFIYDKIRGIPFFKNWKIWKPFYLWRRMVKERKTRDTKVDLELDLFITKRPLRIMLLEWYKMAHKIGKMSFLKVKQGETQTFTDFVQLQLAHMEDVSAFLRTFETLVVDMTAAACRSYLLEEGFSPDKYPEEMEFYMKQLEIPITQLGKASDAMLKYPGQWLSFFQQRQKRIVCKRVTDFLRLIDYLIQYAYYVLLKRSMVQLCLEMYSRFHLIPTIHEQPFEFDEDMQKFITEYDRMVGLPLVSADTSKMLFEIGRLEEEDILYDDDNDLDDDQSGTHEPGSVDLDNDPQNDQDISLPRGDDDDDDDFEREKTTKPKLRRGTGPMVSKSAHVSIDPDDDNSDEPERPKPRKSMTIPPSRLSESSLADIQKSLEVAKRESQLLVEERERESEEAEEDAEEEEDEDSEARSRRVSAKVDEFRKRHSSVLGQGGRTSLRPSDEVEEGAEETEGKKRPSQRKSRESLKPKRGSRHSQSNVGKHEHEHDEEEEGEEGEEAHHHKSSKRGSVRESVQHQGQTPLLPDTSASPEHTRASQRASLLIGTPAHHTKRASLMAQQNNEEHAAGDEEEEEEGFAERRSSVRRFRSQDMTPHDKRPSRHSLKRGSHLHPDHEHEEDEEDEEESDQAQPRPSILRTSRASNASNIGPSDPDLDHERTSFHGSVDVGKIRASKTGLVLPSDPDLDHERSSFRSSRSTITLDMEEEVIVPKSRMIWVPPADFHDFLRGLHAITHAWTDAVLNFRNVMGKPEFNPYTQPIINGYVDERTCGEGPHFGLLLESDPELPFLEDMLEQLLSFMYDSIVDYYESVYDQEVDDDMDSDDYDDDTVRGEKEKETEADKGNAHPHGHHHHELHFRVKSEGGHEHEHGHEQDGDGDDDDDVIHFRHHRQSHHKKHHKHSSPHDSQDEGGEEGEEENDEEEEGEGDEEEEGGSEEEEEDEEEYEEEEETEEEEEGTEEETVTETEYETEDASEVNDV